MGGGAAGTGFSGPQGANIVNPVKEGQIDTAYTGAQNSLQQQQALLQALQAQQGLQNQSNVYGQLQNVAAGQGPNPAQAMLAQQTGQNVANQAAMMAGQRGAGANAGMIARQAAQQGAGTQQQAVGQGATMQAQQSLNALGQAGQMAGQMAGQQIGQTNANTQAQQAEQQALMNAQAGVNSANVSNQAGINAANAGMAQTQMQGQHGLIGNVMGGIGSALGLAEGGMVPGAPNGGSAFPGQAMFGSFLANEMTQPAIPIMQMPGASDNGNALQAGYNAVGSEAEGAPTNTYTPTPISQLNPKANQSVQMQAKGGKIVAHMMAGGGLVPALVSPGEKYLPPQAVKQVEQGANPMQVGETIPGKPKVDGAKNSYANDTVPKTLEEGGIVLPRSVTQAKHPHWAAHAFVKDILSKKGKGLK